MMKKASVILLGWLVCLQTFAKQYQRFEENGMVGMKDDQGQVILPPKFEALGWSDGNFSVVGEVTGYRQNGLWGMINIKKEFITHPEYVQLEYSGGECVVARKQINAAYQKTGCLNLRGEIKIPFVYDGMVGQGLRVIVFNLTAQGFRYGLVDLNNKLLLPVVYKNIRPLGTLRYAVENAEGKIAIVSEAGAKITDFRIDSVSSFYKGFAIIYKDHLQGLINRNGEEVLEAKYSAINITSDGKVKMQIPNEWVFLNEKSEIVQQINASQLIPSKLGTFRIRKGNRWGVVDENLKEIIPVKFSALSEQEKFYVASNDSKTGVIDRQDSTIIPFNYDSVFCSTANYVVWQKNLGWQILNTEGKVISKRFYEAIVAVKPDYFILRSKGFHGLTNSTGEELIHCVFDSLSPPVNGKLVVKFRGEYGIINLQEDWILPPQIYPLSIVNDRVYLLRQPGNCFVKSFSGEIKYFTPYKMDFFENDFIETLPDGTRKTIGYDGVITQRTELPNAMEKVFTESEGLRTIIKDGRYGFVDRMGKLRIANRYDSAGEFHEGLAAIKLIGKWGFVNREDHVVINPNYDQLSNFQNGLAVVSRNKKFGLINRQGVAVLPLRYDCVRQLSNSFLIGSANLKGRADLAGNVSIEPRFDFLREVNDNLLIAGRDGKFGVITAQGISIVPMIYSALSYNPTKRIFIAEQQSEWKDLHLN